jgi:two-component system cell cycle response regulator
LPGGCHCCGGEEFLILLPGRQAPHAAELAELLRSTTERAPLVLDGGNTINVTVTIGVGQAASPAIAVELADEAVYEGKLQGRNCVRQRLES